jgi:hypothetical protein
MRVSFTKSIMVVGMGVMLAAVGCSGIRVVKASKTGGIIALTGDREGAMEKARQEMARTCGGPDKYEITEEGEAVIGSVAHEEGSATAGNNIFGQPAVRTSGTTETTQKTEWRVNYTCKGAAPAPAAADAAAPAAPTAAPGPQGQVHTVVVRF